jgi:hypothetical protein
MPTVCIINCLASSCKQFHFVVLGCILIQYHFGNANDHTRERCKLFMKKLSSILIVVFVCSFCRQDIDIIDPYIIKYGNCHLFEQFDKFIDANGLPDKFEIRNIAYSVFSKEDMINRIKLAEPNDFITLKYSGLEMWYVGDYVIPFTIDIKKIKLKIAYGDKAILDTNLTINKFLQLFPFAKRNEVSATESIYNILNKGIGTECRHFLLMRRSMDSDITLPIEVTFQDGKLIFISFMNVN